MNYVMDRWLNKIANGMTVKGHFHITKARNVLLLNYFLRLLNNDSPEINRKSFPDNYTEVDI